MHSNRIQSDENDVLQQISTLMEDPFFHNFFENNFNDWDSIQGVLMTMKVYQLLKGRYNLDPTQIVETIRKSYKNRALRERLVSSMRDFRNQGQRLKQIPFTSSIGSCN